MKMIPVYEPLIDGNESAYVEQAIYEGKVSASGPFVKGFEDAFAKYIGVNHAISVSSGTAALETALHAVGVGAEDEVILPSFTIISCAIAVLRLGATPVLVDVDADSWNIDVAQVDQAITRKTKAIMPVHMFGNPAPCTDTNLPDRWIPVVEDACQAHGSSIFGVKCGALGAAAAFSFYANKLITTGEGGMVTTSDENVARRARDYRNLYLGSGVDRFVHKDLGANFRMGNLQAALGLAQLERIEEFLEIKRINMNSYFARLWHLRDEEIITMQKCLYSQSSCWMFGLTTPKPAAEMIEKLAAKGVEARPFFTGLHEQPALKGKGKVIKDSGVFGMGYGTMPNTEHLSRHGLYLPSGLTLTEDQIDYVCDTLEEILGVG